MYLSATSCTSLELPQEGSRKRPIDLIETDIESISPEPQLVIKKARRTQIPKQLSILIKESLNENEVSSTRLDDAVKAWRMIQSLSSEEMNLFIESEISIFMALIDGILCTKYFPLQQLYYLILAGCICSIMNGFEFDSEDHIQKLEDYCEKNAIEVIKFLPFQQMIDWKDPNVARKKLLQINNFMKTCSSYQAISCWIQSRSNKSEWQRLKIDPWIDFGGTCVTFYCHDNQGGDAGVFIVDIPYVCITQTEFNEDEHTIHLHTQFVHGISNVAQVVLRVVEEDFLAFWDAVEYFQPNSIKEQQVHQSKKEDTRKLDEERIAASLDVVETNIIPQDSIVQISSTDIIDSKSPEVTPKSRNCVLSLLTLAEPEHVEKKLEFPKPEQAVRYDLSKELDSSSSPELLLEEFEKGIDTLRNDIDLMMFHFSSQFCDEAASVTNSLSAMSALHLARDQEFCEQEYQTRAVCDELTKTRLLDIPHCEHLIEHQLSTLDCIYDEVHTEGIEYLKENLLVKDQQKHATRFIVRLARGFVLLIFVPWILLLLLAVFEMYDIRFLHPLLEMSFGFH